MTTPDKPQWTRHGDTEVAEWRGMRATARSRSVSISMPDRRVVWETLALDVDHAQDLAESLMYLHDQLSRLRERVEVHEQIEKIARYGSFITEQESVRLEELRTRLAELDKETDE